MLNRTSTVTKSAVRAAAVFVYGYSSGKNPFYKEVRGKKLNDDHWSLLLSAPVSLGQKLLLIDARGQNPIQGEIVTIHTVADQMFEVAVVLTRKALSATS